MLTEIDIQRIMSSKRELTESIADNIELEQLDDFEVIETMDEDTPITETNGLM
jgi:hypothetical protein